MGNGFSGCKGYNPFCCGTSHYEINNNVFGNYGEMKIDKDKKIITNIFIPNCQLKISPEGSLDKKNKSKEENHFRIKLKQSKTEMYAKGKNFPQKNSKPKTKKPQTQNIFSSLIKNIIPDMESDRIFLLFLILMLQKQRCDNGLLLALFYIMM